MKTKVGLQLKSFKWSYEYHKVTTSGIMSWYQNLKMDNFWQHIYFLPDGAGAF